MVLLVLAIIGARPAVYRLGLHRRPAGWPRIARAIPGPYGTVCECKAGL
jgi:hypothetical protein